MARMRAGADAYAQHPPIIVNSLPKSGTHLLMQLAEALPGATNYGTFIAQHPSMTLRPRTQDEINGRLSALAPGEVVGAHLHHSPATAQAMAYRNALHLFIWRDPRDVVLSEAHYLAHLARFHAMHRTFKNLTTFEDQVRLALLGDGTERYPAAGERIRPYLTWRTACQNVLCFQYESLTDPARTDRDIHRLIDGFEQQGGTAGPRDQLFDRLKTAIDPERSHTFNKGGIARWRREMSADNQALANTQFEGLLDAS